MCGIAHMFKEFILHIGKCKVLLNITKTEIEDMANFLDTIIMQYILMSDKCILVKQCHK